MASRCALMPGRSRCCHVLAPNCATGGPSGPPMLRFRPFSCPWRSSPPSKVHGLAPQRLFRGYFWLRRSTHWTLSACFGLFPPSKVHPLDPQRLFGDNSAFEGPWPGPSAPVSASFRLRRSMAWTLSACFGLFSPSKVHCLAPQRLFGDNSAFESPPTGPSASLVEE